MSANVSIGFIQIGSAANAVGVFNGQNMQNNWDSHTPTLATIGGAFGNHDYMACQYATLSNRSELGQATFDNDTKLNGAKLWIGP
jgi:hypothetical protein